MKTKIYIYDLEVYENYFSGIFHEFSTGERHEFQIYYISDGVVISTKNNLEKLHELLTEDAFFVGYNNHFYDNQILEYIFQYYTYMNRVDTSEVCSSIYNLSQKIINEHFKDYIYSRNLKYFDLMRVGGLQKGLKSVACNLKQPTIQDLPIAWDSLIKYDDIDKLMKYNHKDVDDTVALFNNLFNKIELRIKVWEKFKINVLNETDSGIANRLLESFYIERTGSLIKDVKRKRTFRNEIKLESIINEDVKFQNPKLRDFLEELKQMKIDASGDKITISPSPSVEFYGVTFKLGAGGIHSEDEGICIEEDDITGLVEADVKSYYPYLMITRKIKPSQLSDDFLIILEELTSLRVKAKDSGDNLTADVYKIVINSIFGKMGSKDSWLYDAEALLNVTVNGQLYLLMLIEWLNLSNFRVISANTDGVVSKFSKLRLDEYKSICKNWMRYTDLTLEYNHYSKYIRRDVNNYIAVTTNNKVKTKGVFNPNLYKDVTKGYSYPIISQAVYNYFVNGKDVINTIQDSKDILDFCTAPKADRKFEILYINYNNDSNPEAHTIESLQKTNRYFVSRTGGALVKREKGKTGHLSFEKDKLVTIINDYHSERKSKMSEYKIDYSYYSTAAWKIIKATKSQKQLNMFK